MPPYQITIADELLRRVPRQPAFFKEVNGIRQLSSAAFKMKSSEDGLSVDIRALTTLAQAVPNLGTHTAAILPARVPLTMGLPCDHNPVPGNDAHALIRNVTSSIARQLAEQATVLP